MSRKIEVNGEVFRVGQEVTCKVKWPDGTVTCPQGALVTVVDGDAYVRTPIGVVAGDAATLEPA